MEHFICCRVDTKYITEHVIVFHVNELLKMATNKDLRSQRKFYDNIELYVPIRKNWEYLIRILDRFSTMIREIVPLF